MCLMHGVNTFVSWRLWIIESLGQYFRKDWQEHVMIVSIRQLAEIAILQMQSWKRPQMRSR